MLRYCLHSGRDITYCVVVGLSEYEHLKYCAAKYVWPKRNARTPKNITWAKWFERKFGENLYEYRERVKSDVNKTR